MPDIFLSYSREDQAKARRFAEAFQRAGLTVWWDQALNPGEAFDDVTERALEEARAVVVLWSRASVGSRWVRAEATQANSSGKLVPVMIEPCKRPIMFELTHTADLSAWKGDEKDSAWIALKDSIRRMMGGPRLGAELPAVTVASRPKRLPFILAAAILLLAGGAWWLLAGRHSRDAVQPAPPTAPGSAALESTPTTTTVVENTLAVLPFEDYSEKQDQRAFVDGLTEELTSAVARVPEIKVVGRTSASRFAGERSDLRAIGQDLHARYLLEGSVRKAGQQLRITAQLIDAQSGLHVWAENYDRRLTDVFAIQEDIATAIAAALKITLHADAGASLVRNREVDQQSYEDFLRARSLARQRQFSQAMALLEGTVKRNPDFAPAWAHRAYVGTFVRSVAAMQALGPGADRSKLMAAYVAAQEENKRDALKAIELDPQLADGYFALAFIEMWLDDWISSEEHFRKALSIDPDLPDALLEYTVLLSRTGRLKEAMSFGRHLVELEPFVPVYRHWSAFPFIAAGRAEEALELQKDVPRDAEGLGMPQPMLLAIAHAAAGQFDQAATELRPISSSAADRLAQAPATIRDANSKPLPPQVNWVYGYTGEPDRLLPPLPDFTGRFYNDNLLWSPIHAPFRKTAAFHQRVQQSGLVDYWRRFGWPEHCGPVGNDFECH